MNRRFPIVCRLRINLKHRLRQVSPSCFWYHNPYMYRYKSPLADMINCFVLINMTGGQYEFYLMSDDHFSTFLSIFLVNLVCHQRVDHFGKNKRKFRKISSGHAEYVVQTLPDMFFSALRPIFRWDLSAAIHDNRCLGRTQ